MAASIKNTTDLIAFVITSLGFTPVSSLVIVFARDGHARGVMRADSDATVDPRLFAQVISQNVSRIENIDSTYLISFEGDQKITEKQYDELGDVLAQIAVPLINSFIVAAGQVREWGDDSEDSLPIDDILSSPVALEILHNKTNIRCSPDNIPPAPQEMDWDGFDKGLDLANQLELLEDIDFAREIGTEFIRWNQDSDTLNAQQAATIAGFVSDVDARDAIIYSCLGWLVKK